MTIKEHLDQEIESLNEPELKQVAEFVAFLKFRGSFRPVTLPDETQLAALYGEFHDEDRELAETGMADYGIGLKKEDRFAPRVDCVVSAGNERDGLSG